MAWTKITKAHVFQRMTPVEMQVNNEAGDGDPDEVDALDKVIKTTTIEVRTAIAEGGKTSLSTDETLIPTSLLNHALSIIVFLFASRVLQQELVVQDARYRAYTTALKVLDEVRSGDRVVEDPETGLVGSTDTAEAFGFNVVRFSRHNFRHL